GDRLRCRRTLSARLRVCAGLRLWRADGRGRRDAAPHRGAAGSGELSGRSRAGAMPPVDTFDAKSQIIVAPMQDEGGPFSYNPPPAFVYSLIKIALGM